MDRQKSYFFGLNLLRFLMAVAIVIYHYRLIFFGAMPYADNSIIHYCYLHGYLSVEVFFALSGFVLYWNYAHKIRSETEYEKSKKVVRGGQRFWSFLLGRIIRIYPLMILTVLFAAASIWLSMCFFPEGHLIQANWATGSGKRNLVAFIMNILGLQSGWISNQDSIAMHGASWFLSILMICYVIFYIILRKCKGDRIIENSCFFLLIMLGVSLYINGGFNFPFLYVCCGRGYVNFFLGALLAQIIHWVDNNKKSFYILLFAIFLITIFVFCYKVDCLGKLGLATSLVISPALLILFSISKLINGACNNHFISMLGNVSFGMYLWHLPLVMVFYLIQDLFKFEVDYVDTYFFISFIIVTIIISSITYVFFEKPIAVLCKKRFRKYLEVKN